MEDRPTTTNDDALSEKLSHQEKAVHDEVADIRVEESGRLTKQGWIGISALLVSYNAYLFTLQMPPAVLAYINADIGPDPNYIWITISWNLLAAVVVTISGRLADIFGRRYFMIAGAGLSTIGAIIGATGQTIPAMIASGVLFGLGGGIQEMVFSCMQEMVPNNIRFIALGCFEFSNLPAMFAPLIAYAWIAHLSTGWRTIYYWCIAWEGLATILLFFFYYPPSFQTKHRDDNLTWFDLVCQLDYVGLVSFTAASILLLMAISWGGTLHPWKSAIVIAPIVVSGCLFVFLGFWEAYADLKHPILPPRLFRRVREFTTILVVSFVTGMLYYSNMTLWPRVSSLLFLPPNNTIMRGLYANLTSFSTTLAGVYLISVGPWVRHERWQLVALQIVQTCMVGGMSAISINSKARSILFTLLGNASATSTSVMTLGIISLLLDDQADIGVAVGLTCTARLIGGAIANAIYTAIYTNRYKIQIPVQLHKYAEAAHFEGPFPALLNATAKNTAAAYAEVPGITDSVITAAETAVKVAYIHSFRVVYYVAIAFGVLSIACCLATRSVPAEVKTKTRAVTMENEKGVHGVAERAAV